MKHLLLPALLLLTTCGEEGPRPLPNAMPDPAERMKENQRAMRIEDRDIDAYIERHALTVHHSGTGVRWALVRDLPGDTARAGQMVQVNHRVELIDGRPCYSSAPGAPESFRVEHDDVESGLHEAIQHMSAGDSAIVIIPSYRAFGLIGDQGRIPGRSTVIYHIGLVKVSGSK